MLVGWCWCLLFFAVVCAGPCPSIQRFTFLMPMGPGSTFLYQHDVALVCDVVSYSVVVCVVGGGVVIGDCLVAVCYCATGIAIVHRRWGPLDLNHFHGLCHCPLCFVFVVVLFLLVCWWALVHGMDTPCRNQFKSVLPEHLLPLLYCCCCCCVCAAPFGLAPTESAGSDQPGWSLQNNGKYPRRGL